MDFSMIKTSIAMLKQIAEFEGFRESVYLDAAGKATIGYGHLIKQGENFGNGITQQEAIDLLAQDVAMTENFIQRVVTVPLNQDQIDAIVSLVYNIGTGAFKRSTLLLLLNDGKYDFAADQFLKWTKAGGRVMEGLLRRREIERKIFLGKS